MSAFAVTAQLRAAAHRRGASVEAWCAAHALHSARALVCVETEHAGIGGYITGLSDTGLTIGYGAELPWSQVQSVVAVDEDQAPGEGQATRRDER